MTLCQRAMLTTPLPLCRTCLHHTRRSFPSTPHLRLHTRAIHSSQFQPLRPPDPSTLARPKTPRKPRKWPFRLLLTTVLGLSSIYILDTRLNASSLVRSARTFGTGVVIAADYKINFRPSPPFAASIEAVHARNAQRIFDLLRVNGGLYLKIGQAIAMQSAILPPEFQRMFGRMFDDAGQNGWRDVERVVREDFGGRSVEEVFGVRVGGGDGMGDERGVMERRARASASVAQVHWARLSDGREVAIKIQKREIARQIGWDLWSFKVVSRIYTWLFDIPMYSLVPYISERLMLETDFVNEADNSEKMAALVAGDSRLRGRVYIPKVYRELSSRRVMTAEWIEGVRLWDKEGITRPWKGGRYEGSPGCGEAPLDPPLPTTTTTTTTTTSQTQSDRPADDDLKPQRDHWKGTDGNGGLGLSMKDVMTTMVSLFSAQMFLWGLVHCDPHPGNIFIRRLPSGKPELVLIDHGLYISIEPHLRRQYALFWKSLLTFDNATIRSIVTSWGITNPDIFASATLMRPYTGGDHSSTAALRGSGADNKQRAYEMQMQMRRSVKQILGDETKLPRELIFIGRNLRIVQGNNQFLGSPVNRIKITGVWASRALAEEQGLTVRERVRWWGRHVVFRVVLLGTDVAFWYARVRQWLGLGGGLEAEIEERMKVVARDFGVELNHSVFEG